MTTPQTDQPSTTIHSNRTERGMTYEDALREQGRSAVLALPNHPDDGHPHHFSCVRCGVDLAERDTLLAQNERLRAALAKMADAGLALTDDIVTQDWNGGAFEVKVDPEYVRGVQAAFTESQALLAQSADTSALARCNHNQMCDHWRNDAAALDRLRDETVKPWREALVAVHTRHHHHLNGTLCDAVDDAPDEIKAALWPRTNSDTSRT